MSAQQRAKEAVDRATTSCERVARQAKSITATIKNRNQRARTEPFELVDVDEEDSLVTSIENVIASGKKEE